MRPSPARLPFTLPRPTLRPSTLVIVGLALVTALVTHRLTTNATRAAAAFEDRVEVVVVTGVVTAGDLLGPANTAVEHRPVAFVPAGAVAGPIDGTARVDLGPGEVLLDHHVAAGVTGPAALLPDGWRGLAVSIYDAAPPLEPGSAVDVYASVDGGAAGLVVDRAVVVAVDDDAVTIGVPADRVPALAFALTNAAVTLALRT